MNKTNDKIAAFEALLKRKRIDKITTDFIEQKGIELDILRLDELHPQVSGNKWFKLKYHVAAAIEQGKQQLISFGGIHSNHLHALADLGDLLSIGTLGVIPQNMVNEKFPTIRRCKALGMELLEVSRTQFKEWSVMRNPQELPSELAQGYIIPLGGAGVLGIKGASEMISDVDGYDHIAIAVGTGTSLLGLLSASNGAEIMGFPVLKKTAKLKAEIDAQLGQNDTDLAANYCWMDQYHRGGLASFDDEMLSFSQLFFRAQEIKLDPVYTLKMMMGIYDSIQKDYFPVGSKILAIHSGGLQGVEGFENRYGVKMHDE